MVAFVALSPPVNPPVTLGALQLYNVPSGTIPLVRFVGLTVKATPLQLTELIAVITAVGLIVTVNVNVVATPQFNVLGVMIYVAVCAVFNGFVNTPVMFVAFVPLAPPVNPPLTLGALQL